MKKLKRILLGVVLSLMSCFLCVGYAQFSIPLTINGAAEAGPPKAVIITDITTRGKDYGTATVNNFSLTVVNSKVTLANTRNSSATFTITVYNNTDVVQGYNAMIYTVGDTTYDNSNIVLSPDIERRTAVRPGEYLTFTVTASYYDKSNRTDRELNSIVTYEFLPLNEIPEDEGEVAVYNVLDKFKKILNTPADYTTLCNEIAANYDGSRDWTATYIGNVVGTEDYENNNDTAIVNDLFDGILTLNINGVDTNVTVIIKRESIDGKANTGSTYYYGNPPVGVPDTEMTLYVTAEDLNTVSSGTAVTVYAATFTVKQDADGEPLGEWYQLGELYQGRAQVVGYIGGYNNGSFDTGTWRLVNANGLTSTTTISDLIQRLS